MHSFETFMVGGAVLLLFSILASKATGRLGIPALLAFLAIGMLAGSEGIVPAVTGSGGIEIDNPAYAQILGVTALCYILFAGGLETDMKVIRPILLPGIVLSSMGTFLTAVLTAEFVKHVLGFTWLEALLLGSIVSSTDAAAVFSILRSKGIHLKSGIKPLLEFESGCNDPVAVLLTIGLLKLMTGQSDSGWSLVPFFVWQSLLGGVLGIAAGLGTARLLNRVRLESEGLYPVLTMGIVVGLYGLTQLLGGSGVVAVYLAGVTLGNQNFIHKKSLVLFHDGISWLMQIAMFLVLGLLVSPSRLFPVAGKGLLISGFLIFCARPASVFASLIGSKFNIREKAMLSFVGLRGSVPIILSTYVLLAGVDRADEMFHVVFFTVLTSVLIQGSPIPWVARVLRVDAPAKQKFRYPIEYVPTENMKSELVEVEVPSASPVAGKAIIELNLPKEVLIVLIQRKGNVIVPKGGTQLEAEDALLMLAEPAELAKVKALLG